MMPVHPPRQHGSSTTTARQQHEQQHQREYGANLLQKAREKTTITNLITEIMVFPAASIDDRLLGGESGLGGVCVFNPLLHQPRFSPRLCAVCLRVWCVCVREEKKRDIAERGRESDC